LELLAETDDDDDDKSYLQTCMQVGGPTY